ncbi:MAG: ATP-binding cassette domain-containing protein [Verrucomicrobiota bacterium]
MERVLQVEGLTKRYRDVSAVEGVDLEVRGGELVGLLGPNGAGKTSTIECILGLRRPDHGRIMVDGVDVSAHPRRARERIGAQLQTSALPDKITPRQAMKLFGAFQRRPVDVDALLAEFGLREKANEPFQNLSGGQRQRLTLALAFLGRPRLLVLDEPTAGLDPAVCRELLDRLAAIRGEGAGVLMSTHDLDEAERRCDRLAIIDRGRLVATGSPAELLSRATAPARVRLRTAHPLEQRWLGALPAVDHVEGDGDRWTLGSKEPSRAVFALSEGLLATRNTLEHLEILRPSLADVFLELTGRSWPDEEVVA